MAVQKTAFPHPYRSLLFGLTVAGLLAAGVLAIVASTAALPADGASTLWVWAGHALTFAIAAFIGELVVAGVTWREPTRDEA